MQLGARAYSPDDVTFLAGLGFRLVELDWRDPHLVKDQLPQLATLQEKYGITYLAHGPNEGNPRDVEEIARRVGPMVRELLQLAPELGITVYTQHLWLDARFLDTEVIQHKIELLHTWVECAAHAGVTLCIENLSEHADHFAPAFQQLPGLAMTLDLGHGEILSQSNAGFGFIARFPERIRHVHAHDNHGGNRVHDDLHLALGEGCIGFAGLLTALHDAGYEGGLCLEVKREQVQQSCETLRQMLGTQGGTWIAWPSPLSERGPG